MEIRFLSDAEVDGEAYSAGDRVVLDDDMARECIKSGKAEAVPIFIQIHDVRMTCSS